jgi:hypothetical protein
MEASPENCFRNTKSYVILLRVSVVYARLLVAHRTARRTQRHRPPGSRNSRSSCVCKCTYQTYQQQ